MNQLGILPNTRAGARAAGGAAARGNVARCTVPVGTHAAGTQLVRLRLGDRRTYFRASLRQRSLCSAAGAAPRALVARHRHHSRTCTRMYPFSSLQRVTVCTAGRA